VDAHPLQGGLHPELAELGVLLKLPHLVHGPEVDLLHALMSASWPISEPLLSLLLEAPPHPVDGGAVDPHVPRDALVRPSLFVEGDHGLPAFPVAGDLVVGREAPHELAGDRALGEHGLDRLAVGPAAEEEPADIGDLFEVEGRVLGLEVDDLSADGQR
jgi:hypothetical protein